MHDDEILQICEALPVAAKDARIRELVFEFAVCAISPCTVGRGRIHVGGRGFRRRPRLDGLHFQNRLGRPGVLSLDPFDHRPPLPMVP